MHNNLKSKGRQRGWQEGRQEEKIAKAKTIAIKLLQQGMIVDQVVKLTGLSLETVEALEEESVTN